MYLLTNVITIPMQQDQFDSSTQKNDLSEKY